MGDTNGPEPVLGARQDTWSPLFGNSDHLLLGVRESSVDLSTLHPEPVTMFRLWQIYLDNVNPILKITHAPTFQARLIEAAENMSAISQPLEALLFAIYSSATQSLGREDALALFSVSKEDLLTRYQFGCQQALLNCSFLRSSDHDCLSALFLYLVCHRASRFPAFLADLLPLDFHVPEHPSPVAILADRRRHSYRPANGPAQ